MEVGVVALICSFVIFLYIIAVAFNLLKEGPPENLAMKIGLVCIPATLRVIICYVIIINYYWE